ncbi:putative transcriptional regulator [Spinactinospora alkalitolerans]|uniref:Putative transcriptional regulator n=1 Tax=Spinactinospora alkalitolerans TaxID=687207 RepID=A0A852TRR8_9ACTN|nr:winged helix-turn-helix domain-containing protein [Spinactinospora alkalitolerans]NYE45393.1 putative transcriptional regulator [Spinactinospora alkalitolerans]
MEVAPTGDALLGVLSALANPQRLRILAALSEERKYVSLLSRELGISRPLTHLHLKRLEAFGLVAGSLELSDDGKAKKWFRAAPFALKLTPEAIAELVPTLSDDRSAGSAAERENDGSERNKT